LEPNLPKNGVSVTTILRFWRLAGPVDQRRAVSQPISSETCSTPNTLAWQSTFSHPVRLQTLSEEWERRASASSEDSDVLRSEHCVSATAKTQLLGAWIFKTLIFNFRLTMKSRSELAA
jgi:hypothetical protein